MIKIEIPLKRQPEYRRLAMKHFKIIIIIIIAVLFFLGSLTSAQANTPTDKKDKKTEADDIFKEAKQAVYKKEWAKAVKEFQRILAGYPDTDLSDDTLYWLGYSLNHLSRTLANLDQVLDTQKQALAQLETLMKRFPSSNWLDDAQMLRVEIAEDLVKKGLKEYKKYILNGAAGDQGAEMKLVALDALLQMDKEKAFPILEKIIRQNSNPELRERALFVLSQTSDPRVVPLLVEVALKDPSREAREKAIFWLGQIQGPESLNQLINIYKSTRDIELKEKLIFSISQHQGDEAAKLLMEIAGNEQEDMGFREKAIFWLGQNQEKKPGVLEFLGKLYETTAKIELREKIIFTISQYDDETAARQLIAFYRKEKNVELKKKIIFWLGQSGSEEARKFIEKIIMETP